MLRIVLASLSLLAITTSPLHAPPPHAPTVADAPRELDIVGVDYAFRNVPAELPPGRTIFHFSNEGARPHELVIVLLAPGVTAKQLLDATNDPKTPRATTDAMLEGGGSVLFAEPGQRSPSAFSTELLPGRTYVLRCTFRDSTSAPRHQMLGMVAVLHVSSGAAADAPASSDTIVASDYAFRHADTLTAGPHRIAFANHGMQRHEVIMARLKPEATLAQVLDSIKQDRDPSPLLDESEGVLFARSGRAALGTLDVDFQAGRTYFIVCTFTDGEKQPRHYMLGMVGSIGVKPEH